MGCSSIAYIPNTSVNEVLSFIRQKLGGGELYHWDEKFHCGYIDIPRFEEYKKREEKVRSIFVYWSDDEDELRETEKQLGLPKGSLFSYTYLSLGCFDESFDVMTTVVRNLGSFAINNDCADDDGRITVNAVKGNLGYGLRRPKAVHEDKELTEA